MKSWVLCLLAAGGIAGFSFASLLLSRLSAQPRTDMPLQSALIRREAAIPTRGEWGQWLRYFRGETHGTKDMVVLAVTLKPGQEPHPPHRHAEEEFLILTEGQGVWNVEGKEQSAQKGDTVYAAPWTLHGLKNTGTAPLTYYMVKWNNKGVDAPEPPGHEPQEIEPGPDNRAAGIVGTWEAEDRHVAMGSLYQPVHDTRQRKSIVTFQREGNRLVGYSLTPNHNAISGMERWKAGRTVFRSVRFSDNRLVFEFDIEEIHHGWKAQVVNRGKVQVKARLANDRLVGIWFMFDPQGAELFRGEWEAVRTKEPPQP